MNGGSSSSRNIIIINTNDNNTNKSYYPLLPTTSYLEKAGLDWSKGLRFGTAIGVGTPQRVPHFLPTPFRCDSPEDPIPRHRHTYRPGIFLHIHGGQARRFKGQRGACEGGEGGAYSYFSIRIVRPLTMRSREDEAQGRGVGEALVIFTP